jgi:hypothetical protein
MTEWKSHGTIYKGSNEIWIAALGPNVASKGEIKEESQLYQNQVAKTLAKLLGLNYTNEREEVGPIIESVFGKE